MTGSVTRSDGFLRFSFERAPGTVDWMELRDLLDCLLPEKEGFGQTFLTVSTDEEGHVFVGFGPVSLYLAVVTEKEKSPVQW